MFGKRSFRGGIHPRETVGGKSVTGSLSIRALAPGSEVAILLSQHTGAPCEPLVKKGDRVLVGQKIGEPGGYVSAPVHASVSGKVAAIAQRTNAAGVPGQAVVIENDGLDEWVEISPPARPDSLSREEVLSLIREAGVVGMGGAAFPTHVKLSPPDGKPIDTLILNGSECEPYLTGDHRAMLERSDDILRGMAIAMKILSAKSGLIGIEDNKTDAIAAMKKAAEGKGVSVVALRTKYPQGGEKLMIQSMTGRQVPSGGLPMDAGVVVINVSTAAAIYDAVYKARPLIERVVTVNGLVGQPANLLARIGTPLSALIEACGGAIGGANKMILGGPMMGLSAFSLDTPVMKGTTGLTLLRDDTPAAEPGNCIRCSSCVNHCPVSLMPLTLHALSRSDRFEQAAAENAMDCIECGTCSFVCPARLPLVHSIRVAKNEIRNRKLK